MSSVYVTQQSALAKYFAINPRLFQVIVNYFEKNRDLFTTLEKKAYFEVKVKYLNALFNQGAYQKIVKEIDEAIELSIQENIYDIGSSSNIYSQLLFKKAVAQYHTHRLDEAVHVLKALIRMNGPKDAYLYLIRRCCQNRFKPFIMQSRAAFIGLLLLTATLIALEIFLIKNFFPAYEADIQLARNITFASSLFVLLMPEFICTCISFFQSKGIERSLRQTKCTK